MAGFAPYGGDRYLRWPEVEAWCAAAAAACPEWCAVEAVGHTAQGRPIPLMTLGAAGPERDHRPAFWLDGGTHAAEWTGVMAAVHTASRWLEGLRGDDRALRHWFETHTVYVMPCMSPDGFHAMREGHPYLRSSLRPPPESTVRVGLDPRDMDGDGAVRWMRWRHPAGPFVADPDLPIFMRPRRLEDDPADAFFVCDEGLLLEWDGHRWTSASLAHGFDLNRNFPGHWAPFSMFGMDGGDYPLSAAESRATVDAFAARPNIGAGLTLHTYTGALLTQPYRKDSPLGGGDLLLMQQLGKEIVDGTGYRCSKVCPDFMYDADKAIVGVWADTMAVTFGVPGYTLELWDPFGYAGVENEKPAEFFVRPDMKVVRGLLAGFAGVEGATTPWRPFEHPQLGPVEIGGIDYMRTVRNPPLAELPGECAKGFRVADLLRRALPRVEATAHISPLGDGVSRVEVVLENGGYLATSGLAHGEGIRSTPTVSAELHLGEGVERVHGPAARSLGHVDGWGSTRSSSGHPIYAALPARGHRAVAAWVVRGSGALRIDWTGGRGGRGSLTVKV